MTVETGAGDAAFFLDSAYAAAGATVAPDAAAAAPQHETVLTREALAVWLDRVRAAELVALDTETEREFQAALDALAQGRTTLTIAHRLSTVRDADEIVVMDHGRIVERGTVDEVLRSPSHPYTKALLSAVPSPRLDAQPDFVRLVGETPSPAKPPSGCHFHQRCPYAGELCRTKAPSLQPCDGADHQVACHTPLPLAEAIPLGKAV